MNHCVTINFKLNSVNFLNLIIIKFHWILIKVLKVNFDKSA